MFSNIWLESLPSMHDRNLHKLPSRARLSKRADTASVGSFLTSSLLYSLLSKIHQLCLILDRGIGRLSFSADWGESLGPRMPYLLLFNWVASTISPTLQRASHQSCMLKSPLSSSFSVRIAGSGLPQQPIQLSTNFFLTSSVALTLSLYPLTATLTLPPTEQGGVLPFSAIVNLSNRELEHSKCLRAAPGWSWKQSGMLWRQSRIWKLHLRSLLPRTPRPFFARFSQDIFQENGSTSVKLTQPWRWYWSLYQATLESPAMRPLTCWLRTVPSWLHLTLLT